MKCGGILRWWRRHKPYREESNPNDGVLPSGLPTHVDDIEQVARFLTSSRQFNQTMVKPSAFLPNPLNGETSVFRHSGQPKSELWEIGRTKLGERTFHGAGIVVAQVVRDAHLDVEAQEPPPRHANIIGWPTSDDPELAKAQQKERAALVAQHATRVLVEE